MVSFNQIKIIHQQRKADTLSRCVVETAGDTLFLSSPTDLGVCRNGGRRGSSYAPKALLAPLLKCTLPPEKNAAKIKIQMATVASAEMEEQSFSAAQDFSRTEIAQQLEDFSGNTVIHLGGGHDHIYPFLSAIEDKIPYTHLKVLNLDAHLDTRTDDFAHSGTPFRQFAEQTKKDFSLFQLGIHPYSNGASNYTPFKRGRMEILPQQNCLQAIKDRVKLDDGDLLILSLDCDALNSAYMEGVSAVNHDGLELATLDSIFQWYKAICKKQTSLIGIYEYNPIYDNLSQKGARSIASVIYRHLFSS